MKSRKASFEVVLGMLGPFLFVASWVVAGLLRDGYDISEDSISRLAEYGAPNRWIVLTGTVVISLAALYLGALLRRRWALRLGTVMIAFAGTSALALAVFPCSPGCPGISGEFTDSAHSVSALIHYIAFALSPIVIAAESGARTGRLYKVLSIAAGVVGALALVSQYTGWGPTGITQRVGLTTLDAWMALTAFQLWRSG